VPQTRVVAGYRESVGSWVSRIVMFVFGVIELLILVRFALLLFGANTQSMFVQWVHQISGIFMAPFNAIFGTQTVNGATFEWSALVAIAVYALIAWLIVALLRAVTPVRGADTVETVETEPVVRRRRFNWWRRA
jgi:YggT family protein